MSVLKKLVSIFKNQPAENVESRHVEFTIEHKQLNRFNKGIKLEYHENGERLGRATIYILYNELHDQPFGLLEDLFVEPGHRKRSIGSKLTEEAVQYANFQGCYKLICTSRYTSKKIYSMYKKYGFKDHGREFRIDYPRK